MSGSTPESSWNGPEVGAGLLGRAERAYWLTLQYSSPAAGLGMADAVEFVVKEVERRDLHHVVPVGHSWGGYPVTGAAHALADRLARVVYCNAVVPAIGTSIIDENDEYAQVIRTLMASTADPTVPLPLEAVRTGLMPDEPREVQELVWSLTLPQPGRYMLDALDVPYNRYRAARLVPAKR